MKNRHFLLAVTGSLALVCAVALGASSKGTRTYSRWVDENGQVHIGDKVPPEYAEQARQELNKQGVPVREFPRQLTQAEADEARKAAAEAERLREHDSYLRNTYTSVGDIEQGRDERIALIDGQVALTRDVIATTNQRLAALQNRLGAFRPYSAAANARRVPDTLAEEVVRALSERRSMSTQLQQREKERAEQLASFEADIARYKELKASSSKRAAN
jgi:hypothetical protein